jgi:hypothetical protein
MTTFCFNFCISMKRLIGQSYVRMSQSCFVTSVLSLLLIFNSFVSPGQVERQGYNFGFEKQGFNSILPEGWVRLGDDYAVQVDKQTVHGGKSSVLIHQLEEKIFEHSSGSIAYTIPSNFDALEIEVKAFVKLKNVDGKAGLMLRIDDDFGTLDLENLETKSIHGTQDWTEFSFRIPFPANSKFITIGAILSGKGQLWVDDFQVLLDGKNIVDAKQKPEKGARLDKEFDYGSNISAIDISPLTLQHLDVLGKIWGFLKYYHPMVSAGNYNWDYELFRILPIVLQTANEKQRNGVLKDWIESYGEIPFNKNSDGAIKGQFKLLPDLSWIDQKVLGKNLVELLHKIEQAKASRGSYYIEKKLTFGLPQLTNEVDYSAMTYPDAGFRLLSLYRYWNFIHYYFPYRHLIREDWKSVLTEYIPKFLNAANELEYQLTALSLIARIHDTHANIWGWAQTLTNYKGTKYAPFEVTFIDDKAVVTDYRDEPLAKKSGIKIGDIIEFVDGKAVNEIVKERLPLTPASNYPTQLRDLGRDLLRTSKPALEIKYSHGNTTASTEVETSFPYFFAKHDNYHKEDSCFKLIDSDIAYLYPGLMKNEFLPKIMAEVKKTKGLIVDFRCYPSAFLVFTLTDYLLPEKKAFAKFTKPSLTNPGAFLFTEEVKIGHSNEGYYKGKVVIIVNEQTQSQAEYTTMALRIAPKATVIGSTTAGADGDIIRFFLPGGILTSISGLGVYYPDGRETQRVGIIPDIEVKRTIQGVKEGRDELLGKAIQIIKNE